MDRELTRQLNISFPRENDRKKVCKSTMKKILNDTFNYGYLSALDDVFAILREEGLIEKDLILGELHLLTHKKLKEIPADYKARTMENIEWIIDFTSKKTP